MKKKLTSEIRIVHKNSLAVMGHHTSGLKKNVLRKKSLWSVADTCSNKVVAL